MSPLHGLGNVRRPGLSPLADQSLSTTLAVHPSVREFGATPRRRSPCPRLFCGISAATPAAKNFLKAYSNLLNSTFCAWLFQPENMACGSGSSCCGPPAAPQLPASANNSTPVADSGSNNDSCDGGAVPDSGGSCGDACCGADVPPTLNETPAPVGCQSGCCDTEAKKPAQIAETAVKIGTEDTCCDAPPPPKTGDKITDPGCCDGTELPCCDDSCLERLALRACETGKKPVILVESYEGVFASYGVLRTLMSLADWVFKFLRLRPLARPPNVRVLKTASPADITKASLAKLMPLPCQLLVVFVALCWPSARNPVVRLRSAHLSTAGAARSAALRIPAS